MKQFRVILGVVLIILVMNSVAMAADVFMPHLTGGFDEWEDFLTVDNVGLVPANVTVTLFDDTGNQVYNGSHAVTSLGESVIDLKQLSSTAQSGKVTYTGENLHFRLSLLNIDSGGVAEFFLGFQSSVLAFFFSDFESVVAWKGIALANYGAVNADVTLYAIGGGQVLDTADIVVPAYSKTSGVHSTWFSSLAMTEVKKIIAVSSVATLGGIAIASNASSSSMLFTPAVRLESFSGAEYTGIWRGKWESYAPGFSGDVVMHLVQTGEPLLGTADLGNTDCGDVKGVPVSGTVMGQVVTFAASYACMGHLATLEFTQGTRRGNRIDGTYQQNVNGQLYDSGTFWLIKD